MRIEKTIVLSEEIPMNSNGSTIGTALDREISTAVDDPSCRILDYRVSFTAEEWAALRMLKSPITKRRAD